ncbi:MAG: hypothetical protein BWX47_01864 [candidate division Hyd24-12 bacterium ADurb.Bin004]|nr:MAG: hypothetical protein BWX47_01864 [candidate division Hyd24-12 bacterium ADurb.Bin004]
MAAVTSERRPGCLSCADAASLTTAKASRDLTPVFAEASLAHSFQATGPSRSLRRVRRRLLTIPPVVLVGSDREGNTSRKLSPASISFRSRPVPSLSGLPRRARQPSRLRSAKPGRASAEMPFDRAWATISPTTSRHSHFWNAWSSLPASSISSSVRTDEITSLIVRSAASSSRTDIPGGSPSSKAYSSTNRSQTAFTVPNRAAPSLSASAHSPDFSSLPRTRCFSSDAAFTVNVVARMASGRASPLLTASYSSSARRYVFPLPALAVIILMGFIPPPSRR